MVFSYKNKVITDEKKSRVITKTIFRLRAEGVKTTPLLQPI